jgi:hypothetical protein
VAREESGGIASGIKAMADYKCRSRKTFMAIYEAEKGLRHYDR